MGRNQDGCGEPDNKECSKCLAAEQWTECCCCLPLVLFFSPRKDSLLAQAQVMCFLPGCVMGGGEEEEETGSLFLVLGKGRVICYPI